jgi:hypothetical protein
MKQHVAKWIAGVILCLGLTGQALALGFLDDMIYSVKCSGADDKEACKAKARQDFEDYQQRKQGGAAATGISDDTARSASSGPDVCRTISLRGAINVDTAYINAMKTFNFGTQEELENQQRFRRGIVNPRFKHVRTPGVMYDMWDFIDIPGVKGRIRPMTSMRLSKSDKGGTDMDVEYCLGRNAPGVSDPSFWDTADKAFRSVMK